MVIHRRKLLRLAGATAAVAVWPHAAWAETYPSRPVRILVGYAAGGGVDIAARLIGQWLSERLQQQFVVENCTGAATNIATEAVVRSPPDGYTFAAGQRGECDQRDLLRKSQLQFHARHRAGRGHRTLSYFMAVNPAFPAKNVSESSPTRRPIRARSIWGPAARAGRTTPRASSSS
jgi:tripartite-type tricarboxylate transporter receptor subunit TctC